MPRSEQGPLGRRLAARARGRGELEVEVLAYVAASEDPVTAAQVQAAIGGLAYTTVMTTLSRLYAKGAVERHPAGRAYGYSVSGGQAAARSNMAAHQMLKVLDSEADRLTVLRRFVAELPAADGKLLADLLDDAGAHPPDTHVTGTGTAS